MNERSPTAWLVILQLVHYLAYGGYVVGVSEISVSGESLAFLAVHENFDGSDLRVIGADCFNHREDRQFFYQDSRTMTISKSGIHIQDCEIILHKVSLVDVYPG